MNQETTTDWTKMIAGIITAIIITLQGTNMVNISRVDNETVPKSTIDAHIVSIDRHLGVLETRLLELENRHEMHPHEDE